VDRARYDGHADWYDEKFRDYGSADGSGGVVARLLGPADPGGAVCLDVGCGTGLHFAAVRAGGYTVVGVDFSGDQLRRAASREPRLVRGDARRLPLAGGSVPAVLMTFTHTDIDDFPAAVGEAARVLRPGGRLVYLGPHPAYVGAFADRSNEVDDGRLCLAPGYGDERLQRDASGRFPVRSRVGARNLTLATFLGAFLAQETLRLSSVEEFDTRLRPWRADATDRRVVPWNLAVTAVGTPGPAR
jgi:SAM-dependent methyltransferase